MIPLRVLTLALLMIIFPRLYAGIGNAVDSTAVIQVNDLKHFISLKGKDKSKPLILFLHGGPGRSLRPAAESFNQELYRHFIVVHWDQRMTAKSQELNDAPIDLSIKLLKDDTYAMIQFLLKSWNREQLYLVSHSWSSAMGFNMATNHPGLIKAYIAISPVIDQAKNTELTIAMLKDWAKKNENEDALKELNSVNIPIQTKTDLYHQQKWLFIHNGVGFASKPGFKNEYYSWMDIWFPLVHEDGSKNLFQNINSVGCPLYVIEGNADGLESHQLAKDYFDFLKADTKEFYWFTNSGHTVFNTEPEKLQETIINIAKELE